MSEQPPTRPPNCPLHNDSKLAEIAERAAERAIEKLTNHVYQQVGRRVVEKLFYIIGVCVVGLYLWLKSKGVI